MLKSTVIAALMISSVFSQCITEDDTEARKKVNPEARTLLYKGQMEFTLKLFNAINKAVPEDNIFFSPFSVYHSLLLAYFISTGKTSSSLQQSLSIAPDLDKINLLTAYKVDKRVRTLNNNSDSYEFNNVNKLFTEQTLNIRKCLQDMFGDEMEALNFHQEPAMSRQYINRWAEQITKSNIKELLPEGAISDASKLVLANAAYFKGVWASKFLAERTKKDVFYVSETRQTLVPFMKQKGTFHYIVSEELGAQILELPYKGNDISMYILLPPYSNKEGVTNIIENLTAERLAAVVDEGYMGREVIVEIPKFTIEKSLPLRHILETMGVKGLFEASLDFSTVADEPVQFDDAVHKAKIQLDEEGTTAAAATAIFGFRSSRPVEPARFVANFPFVYVIYERPTSSILFMGVYRDPKK